VLLVISPLPSLGSASKKIEYLQNDCWAASRGSSRSAGTNRHDSGGILPALWGPVVTVRTARFNVQQFYVLPTQCVYVFCVDLRTNSDYFPIQH
jgi:hypothetical protein